MHRTSAIDSAATHTAHSSGPTPAPYPPALSPSRLAKSTELDDVDHDLDEPEDGDPPRNASSCGTG